MYVLSLDVLVLTPRHRLPVINRFMLGILDTEPENTIREINIFLLGFPDIYAYCAGGKPDSLG